MTFLPSHIPLEEAVSSLICEDQAGWLLQSQWHCDLYDIELSHLCSWPDSTRMAASLQTSKLMMATWVLLALPTAYLNRAGVLPAFCSKIGAVASGTVFISKGFSEGSSVYWCRAFSMPGTETVNPEKQKHRQINSVLTAGTVRNDDTGLTNEQCEFWIAHCTKTSKISECEKLTGFSVTSLLRYKQGRLFKELFSVACLLAQAAEKNSCEESRFYSSTDTVWTLANKILVKSISFLSKHKHTH